MLATLDQLNTKSLRLQVSEETERTKKQRRGRIKFYYAKAWKD